MNKPLINAETRQAIVAAYQRGEKIQAIQDKYGIPRASIYWVLEQADVTPDRVKRGVRLAGDNQQLAQLYDLINAQHERILQLEEMVRSLGGTPD